jgi:hypothetical protein
MQISSQNEDVQGDLYEYLLSRLSDLTHTGPIWFETIAGRRNDEKPKIHFISKDPPPSHAPSFRSTVRGRIRHDLQQRFRRDRDLSDERPIMRGNQQDGGGHAGRK